MDEDDSLSVEEAAKLLFVSQTHANTLVQRGDLTAVQKTPDGIVRILRTDVLKYRNKIRAEQKAGLEAMMDASERLGLYDQELEGLPNHRND